jgi:hypothetical protein
MFKDNKWFQDNYEEVISVRSTIVKASFCRAMSLPVPLGLVRRDLRQSDPHMTGGSIPSGVRPAQRVCSGVKLPRRSRDQADRPPLDCGVENLRAALKLSQYANSVCRSGGRALWYRLAGCGLLDLRQ